MAIYFKVPRGTYSSWESKYKYKKLPRKKHLMNFLRLEMHLEVMDKAIRVAKIEEKRELTFLEKLLKFFRKG